MTYRPAPELLFEFLTHSEANILRVYDDAHPKRILAADSKISGTLTGGVGHTGRDVRIGMRVTRTLSLEWLHTDVLNKAVKPLASKVSAAVIASLSDHQYAALLSFVFNLGTGDRYVDGKFVKSTWGIWKILNKGLLDGVPAEMSRFDKMKVDGVLVQKPGLAARRAAEISLWHTADVTASVAHIQAAAEPAPPSNEVRVADTPPTPAAVKPLMESKSFIASAATAVAAAPVMINSVRETIQPYADASPHLQKILGTLAVMAAGLAVLSLVLMWLKNQKAKAA
jgi:lysozyme